VVGIYVFHEASSSVVSGLLHLIFKVQKSIILQGLSLKQERFLYLFFSTSVLVCGIPSLAERRADTAYSPRDGLYPNHSNGLNLGSPQRCSRFLLRECCAEFSKQEDQQFSTVISPTGTFFLFTPFLGRGIWRRVVGQTDKYPSNIYSLYIYMYI
jgi:hypothetical protein